MEAGREEALADPACGSSASGPLQTLQECCSARCAMRARDEMKRGYLGRSQYERVWHAGFFLRPCQKNKEKKQKQKQVKE